MPTSFDSNLVRKNRNDLDLENVWYLNAEQFLELGVESYTLYDQLIDLKGQRKFCKRSDFRPGNFKRHLPNIVLFDLGYDLEGNLKDAIFRLIGTNVASFYGELTGESLFKLSNKDAIDRSWKAINMVVEKKDFITVIAEQNTLGKPYYKSEVLLIPFSDDGTQINKILAHVSLSTERPKP